MCFADIYAYTPMPLVHHLAFSAYEASICASHTIQTELIRNPLRSVLFVTHIQENYLSSWLANDGYSIAVYCYIKQIS